MNLPLGKGVGGGGTRTLTPRFQSWNVLGSLSEPLFPPPPGPNLPSGPQSPRWSKWEEKGKIRIQSALFRAMGRNLHLNFIFVLGLAKRCPPSSE